MMQIGMISVISSPRGSENSFTQGLISASAAPNIRKLATISSA